MDVRSEDGGSRQLQGDQRAEPVVRSSRWAPKQEQVRILETIFNSGMIKPPKNEMVRIRKQLEKFGAVADKNIFYWFQNRRFRSRQRQRQIEARRLVEAEAEAQATPCSTGIINPNDNLVPSSLSCPMNTGPCVTGSTSSPGPDHAQYSGEFLSLLGQSDPQVQQYEQNPLSCSPGSINFPYQSEVITVFINGVATEVGREGLDIKGGGLDIKGMFGGDNFVMFDSSGVLVQVNEYGFLVLHEGENYFLVIN